MGKINDMPTLKIIKTHIIRNRVERRVPQRFENAELINLMVEEQPSSLM